MPKNITQNSDDKEKKESIDVFKGDLVNILDMDQPEDGDIISYYNVTLMRMMLEDKVFQRNLTNALRDNQEKLTAKEFILNNKPVRPTIANWLKDFISQYGADMFDNVKLSHYFTMAKNVKILDGNEKKSVKKLLLLYRNLAFFPDSMKDTIVGDWEIIPVEKEEKLTKIGKQVTSGKLQVSSDKVPAANFASGADKQVMSDKMMELEKMAEQYPVGSLERRAISEEISKLQGISTK